VDVIGLSILSGVHMELTKRLVKKLRESGAGNIPVAVGGVIPPGDVEKLKEVGVAGVFSVGTSFKKIVDFIRNI